MTDLIALDDQTRVWIYQADTLFEDGEIFEIKEEIAEFVDQWISHNRALRSYGNFFHRRFIALFVDESQAPASGCSIDSSVRFVNGLGAKYGRNMIERDHFAYIKDDEVQVIHMNSLSQAYKNGEINDQTLFFDHLVRCYSRIISLIKS